MMSLHDKCTILVVYDESSIRNSLGRRLEMKGYAPILAGNGEEALKRVSEQEFEVVILDIMMPGLSGLDVLRRIQTDQPETSVIMFTAMSDMSTAVNVMKLGAYDYVTKPFNLDDILLRVEKARERRMLLLERKDYQTRLEGEVAEKTAHLENKMREVNALNEMIQSRLNQVFAAQETHGRVAAAIEDLAEQMHGLAASAKITAPEEAARRGNTSLLSNNNHGAQDTF